MEDIWINQDYSVFTKGSKGQDRSPIVTLFAPIVSLPTLALFYFWSGAIFTALLYTAGAIVGVGTLRVLVYVAEQYAETHLDAYLKRIALERSKKYDEEVDDLVCTGVPMPASLNALSKKKKTLYLRFKDLKAAVCRPYAA